MITRDWQRSVDWVGSGLTPTPSRAWLAWAILWRPVISAVSQPDLGEELGKGRTVAEITASTRQVAEGVKFAPRSPNLLRSIRLKCPSLRTWLLLLPAS